MSRLLSLDVLGFAGVSIAIPQASQAKALRAVLRLAARRDPDAVAYGQGGPGNKN